MGSVQQEFEAEKAKIAELSETKDKWEAEANRLRNRYETLEGFINAATEEAVLTSFLADAPLWEYVRSFEHADSWRSPR